MMPPPSTLNVALSSLPNFAPSASIARVESKTTLLPPSYEPGPYSVIMGRGKESFNSIGNRRLRVLVDTQLEKYSQATSKEEKSAIVTNIVHFIQEACPEGPFIKFDYGQWWAVDYDAAREKVGSTIRYCMHHHRRRQQLYKFTTAEATKKSPAP
jgi:hypothetical protein